MKILITNTVALNGGDAAILLSIIRLLRQEFGQDTEFTIYDSNPEIASRLYPELTFRKLIYLQETIVPVVKQPGYSSLKRLLQYLLRGLLKIVTYSNPSRFYFAAWCWQNQLNWLSKLLVNDEELQDIQNYSSADLIVSSGGTYLVKNYAPLTARTFDYKLSLMMQKPLVFFTQSMGPFLTQEQQLLRKIFNRSLLILLRDEASLKHLKEIHVDPENVHLSSDVAFAFTDKLERQKSFLADFTNSSPLKVAISVRHWHFFQAANPLDGMNVFQQALQAVTQYLVETYNAEITYISTCQGIAEYWTDDSKVAMEITKGLPPNIQRQVKVNRMFHTPEKLLGILRTYDMVIATRMHMAILALVANTPVLPIAYEFKTKELFNRLDMSEWVHDIETIQPDSLIASVKSFLESLPKIKKKLHMKVAEEKESAINSGRLTKTLFEQWRSQN